MASGQHDEGVLVKPERRSWLQQWIARRPLRLLGDITAEPLLDVGFCLPAERQVESWSVLCCAGCCRLWKP